MEDRFKFRAWDKNKEVMRYIAYSNKNSDKKNEDYHSIIFVFDNTWSLLEGASSKYKKIKEITSTSNSILMQCTGMKDMYGKLIYEGDIVEWVTTTWDNGTKGKVEWSDSGWLIEGDYTLYKQKHQIKIIGNKYQNSKLLKEII